MLLFRESIRGFFMLSKKAERVLITKPWIRLRHHCRFFFRQFIPPDMMIFQEDMAEVKARDSRVFSLTAGFSSHSQMTMVCHPISANRCSTSSFRSRFLLIFSIQNPVFDFERPPILATFMSMPEASIHQNAGAILPQYNIRFPRQPWMIESIPESPSPQELPDKNLRFGILALDCRHVIVALLYGHSIWHTLYLQSQGAFSHSLKSLSPYHR